MSLNLLFAIISASLLFNIFKYFENYKVVTLNAIVVNYLVASSLSFLVPEETKSIAYAINQPWLPIAILLGFIFVSLFQVMAYASQLIGVATTTIANKITFIFPTALGIIFFNEDWNLLKLLGFIVAIAAIFLSAEKKIELPKGNSYAIIALLFFGGGVLESLLNYSNKHLIAKGDTSFYFGYLFFFAFVFGIIMMIRQILKTKTLPTRKDILWGVILGIPNYFSMYLLLESLDELPSSTVFPVANMGVILFSTLFSVILFKEEISKKKALALGCSILAIALISFYNII